MFNELTGSQPASRPVRGTRRRSGFTLLELLLALALSTMVIYAIVWAIQLHLRSLDVRRTTVEEAQLGRSLLKMISDDLRGALQHREQDYSGVEDVLANALSSAAEELATEAGLLEDALMEGGLEGEPPAGGEPPGGGEPPPGGGVPGGGGVGGVGGAGATGEEELADEEMTEESVDLSYTEDIADGGLVAPVVGIFGNSTQLQIDVSRVQRMDEMYTMAAATTQAVPVSDIKSTSYYIRGALGGVSGAGGTPMTGMTQRAGAFSGAPFDPFGATSGLVRRVVNRSSAVYESTSGLGSMGGLGGGFDGSSQEEIISAECVDVQFEYFDGFEWAPEWDSLIKGGLPFAIAVQLTLQTDNRTDNSDPNEPPELMVFRQIVSIPIAEPISPEEAEETLEELQSTEAEE